MTTKQFPNWNLPAEQARDVDDIQAEARERTPATRKMLSDYLDDCDQAMAALVRGCPELHYEAWRQTIENYKAFIASGPALIGAAQL